MQDVVADEWLDQTREGDGCDSDAHRTHRSRHSGKTEGPHRFPHPPACASNDPAVCTLGVIDPNVCCFVVSVEETRRLWRTVAVVPFYGKSGIGEHTCVPFV